MASSSDESSSEAVEYDDIDRAIVNYILTHSSHKRPIKCSDLTPLMNNNNRLLKVHLPKVTSLLRDKFGIIVKQISSPTKMLITYAEAPMASIYEMTEQQRSDTNLLYIVLTYIFLRTDKVEDVKLYQFMESLGINVDESHSNFGDNIRNKIEDTFVKQKYISREKTVEDEYQSSKVFFSWGDRSKLELPYEVFVKFACKLLKLQPDFFRRQLNYLRAIERRDETLQPSQEH